MNNREGFCKSTCNTIDRRQFTDPVCRHNYSSTGIYGSIKPTPGSPLTRAYPSAEYAAFNSFALPTIPLTSFRYITNPIESPDIPQYNPKTSNSYPPEHLVG